MSIKRVKPVSSYVARTRHFWWSIGVDTTGHGHRHGICVGFVGFGWGDLNPQIRPSCCPNQISLFSHLSSFKLLYIFMAHNKQTILVNLGNAEKKLDDLMASLFLEISPFFSTSSPTIAPENH